MEEHIEFNPSFTMLTLALAPGESVKAEAGAMVCQSGVEMKTGMTGGGGIGGFFKSMAKSVLTNETFFLNTFTAGPAGGWVSLAPGSPGDIAWFDCQPGQNLYIQGASYLASTANVETDTKFQGAKGLLSGERLFFIRAFTQAGAGRVYYNSYGAVKQIPIQAGQVVTVDTGHVVAFTDGVDYQIGKVGGIGSMVFGGEGLVMHFSGQGTVWVQTRNIGALAGILAPFFPTGN